MHERLLLDIMPEFGSDFSVRVRAIGMAWTERGVPVEVTPELGEGFQVRLRSIAIDCNFRIPVDADPESGADCQQRLSAVTASRRCRIGLDVEPNRIRGGGRSGRGYDGADHLAGSLTRAVGLA